jgi:pyruvyltransferase
MIDINIFFVKSSYGKTNFGDAVNKVFWEIITNKNIITDKKKEHYITTGSIMSKIQYNSIILGTGIISNRNSLKHINKNDKKKLKQIKCLSVRGPLTRNLLLEIGILCPENYGDPLILMPCIYDKYEDVQDNIVGIIPHYIDKKNNNVDILVKNLENNGYKTIIIDIEVGSNYTKLINNINKCKYIISSSLHGIIMGLVYKKKTIFLEFSNRVIGNRFKFYDFFGSIKVDFEHKNSLDVDILDNTINIDYNNLIDLGVNFINIIPFIDNNRKKELIDIYNNFYT